MITLLKLTLVLSIILLTPMLCRRIHVPSLVGFILAGVLFGPHGIGWIQGGETVELLGKMGLLYILFQAGVEIDLNNFQQYRRNAVLFGFLTFLCPFLLGILTTRLLGFGWVTSLLMGSMYGSHTLMTYPIVSRYGIQKNAAVNITVGGTMLAITLSLLVLAIVEGSHIESSGTRGIEILWTIGKIALTIGSIVWLMPEIVRRFFKRWSDTSEHFVLVMLLLVISAVMAEWAGIDGILGAFLCGVALNRLIPNLSPLMGRINFVGSTIFVPIFLLGVGLLIDTNVLISEWSIYLISTVMIATKLLGKWLASYAAEKIFHLSHLERRLIFGLTHATAAGTLAVVTIGYQMGVFNIEILNGAVIMILVLCTISGFVTEHAAKQLALQEEALLESERTHDNWLMMSVGEDLHNEIHELSTLSQLTETQIQQSADWQEAKRITEYTATSIAIYHEVQPLGTINRLLVAIPRYAEKERDFISCFGQLRRLSSQIGARITFFANPETQVVLRKLCNRPGKFLPASYQDMEDWEDVLMIAKQAHEDDLIVMISARQATASYNPLFEQIPNLLERFFKQYSYLIIYPEQGIDAAQMDSILMDIPQSGKTWSLLTGIKQYVLRQWRKRQFSE